MAEDATVTRNAGFTLGGVNFANKTFTLGSATTDMTLVDNSALTGESVPEPRSSAPSPEGTPLMEGRNVQQLTKVTYKGYIGIKEQRECPPPQ